MYRKLLTSAIALGIAAPFLSASAAAPPKTVDLTTWDKADLKSGWSAEALMDEDVYGPGGDEIGEVEDILVGPDGKIQAILVDTDAFLDIGDVHARVAWSKVSGGPEEDSVSVPVTEDTLENFRMDYEGMSLKGKRSWRAEELIGDSVMLQDKSGYGMVDDIIFDNNDELAAVIVDADYGRGFGAGPYAYPYYGYDTGWNPGMGHYDLPYGRDAVSNYKPFEYEQRGPFQD